MNDVYTERIRPIADQIYDILAANKMSIWEFREVFKLVQGRINARAIIPQYKPTVEGGEFPCITPKS